jgi:hypothetical protein
MVSGPPRPRANTAPVHALLLHHPSARVALGLIVLHQAIVAVSTYFLTRLIVSFEAGQSYRHWLYLYLIFMAIPYLPGCLSLFFMQRWINSAHRALVELFACGLRGKASSFRDSALKERVGAAMAGNALPAVRDYIAFIHDLTGFTLNSALSMFFIGILLPGNLLVGYAISLLLCILIILATRGILARASADYESSFIHYSSILGAAWENLTLGNRHNERLWQERRAESGASFYGRATALQGIRQGGNVILATASLLPTIALIVLVSRNDLGNANMLAAVIVSLTRIFLILNSLSALVYKALDFSSVHSRLAVIMAAAGSLRVPKENDRMPGEIQINGTKVVCVNDAICMIKEMSRGRLTITGGNGSGKSTMLLALKDQFMTEGFLLPAYHHRLVWRSDLANLSSGQRARSSIMELLELNDVRVIFLDEWDANLDVDNTKFIDALLERSAQDKVIVEVRH